MEQRIKAGEVIPMFRLPDANGRIISRQQFRGRANLLLVFPPDLGPVSLRYLRELSADAARWNRDETALIIATASVEELQPLAREISIPLLADVENRTRSQFLPAEAAGGWFATDRWGELYAQGHIASARELPPPQELRGWLEFIACECGG